MLCVFFLINKIILIPQIFCVFEYPCISFHIESEDKSPEDDSQRESSLVREVSGKMVCSACRCTFSNREEQVTTELQTSDVLKTALYHGFFFSFEQNMFCLLNFRWSTTRSTGIGSTWDWRFRECHQSQLRSLRGRLELVSPTHVWETFKAAIGCWRVSNS